MAEFSQSVRLFLCRSESRLAISWHFEPAFLNAFSVSIVSTEDIQEWKRACKFQIDPRDSPKSEIPFLSAVWRPVLTLQRSCLKSWWPPSRILMDILTCKSTLCIFAAFHQSSTWNCGHWKRAFEKWLVSNGRLWHFYDGCNSTKPKWIINGGPSKRNSILAPRPTHSKCVVSVLKPDLGSVYRCID